MQVYDLVELLVDDNFQEVDIFDTNGITEASVWKGRASDIPDKYLYQDICSIDNLSKDCVLTINICTEY